MKRIFRKTLITVGFFALALDILFIGLIAYKHWERRTGNYTNMNHEDMTLANCNKILEKNPDDVSALKERADYYKRNNEIDKSTADEKRIFDIYTKRIEKNPKDADAYLARSSMHIPEFTAFYKIPQSAYEKEISDLTHFIELKPGNIEAYFKRGDAYLSIDLYDKAIADLTKCLDVPFYLKYLINDEDYGEALSLRSQAYFEIDQYDKAEADLRKASDVRKENSYPNPEIRWIYAHGWKNHVKCIEACNRILKHKPDYDYVIGLRGEFYAENKQYDEAIADLTKMIELHPDSSENYRNRSIAYKMKGDYKSALSDCEYAINKRFQLDEAYNLRGQIYLGMKEYNKAIDDFNTSINFYNWSEPYIYRGDTYRLIGDDKKAIEDYTIAIALVLDDNNGIRAILEQAKLLEKAGKNDEAIKSYKLFKNKTEKYFWDNSNEDEIKFAVERLKALEG
jgi:tetratricopeptide (TPR) repeat protein